VIAFAAPRQVTAIATARNSQPPGQPRAAMNIVASVVKSSSEMTRGLVSAMYC